MLGLWSDESDIWTNELKKALNHKNADDGIFWMNVFLLTRFKITQTIMITPVRIKFKMITSILFKNTIFQKHRLRSSN